MIVNLCVRHRESGVRGGGTGHDSPREWKEEKGKIDNGNNYNVKRLKVFRKDSSRAFNKFSGTC